MHWLQAACSRITWATFTASWLLCTASHQGQAERGIAGEGAQLYGPAHA